MTRRSLFFTLAAGLLALSLGGTETRAGGLTLADLLVPGATIEVKGSGFDFLFSGFSYFPTGYMPAPAAVDVSTVFFNGSAGLEFSGAFGTPVGTPPSDALLSYTVTSELGKITDVQITGNPAVLGGSGAMTVTDTLYVPGTTTSVGKLSIYDIESSPGLNNSAQLVNNQSLYVKKDIFAQSSVTGVATLSYVDQTYSTAIPDPASFSTAIPEPASFALLGIGLSGLFTLRRFFKRTSVA